MNPNQSLLSRVIRLAVWLAALPALQAAAQPLPGEAALEKRIATLRSIVEAGPKDVGSWHDLASLLRDAGRWDEAIDAESRALAVHPKFAVAHYGRGLARMEKRDYPGARADLTAAIGLWESRGGVERFTTVEIARDEHVDAYRQRGVAFGHEGRWPDAVTDLGTALKLRPDDPRLLFERAHLLEKASRKAEAIAGFRRAGLVYAEARAAGPAHECATRLSALGARAEADEVEKRLLPRPSGRDLP